MFHGLEAAGGHRAARAGSGGPGWGDAPQKRVNGGSGGGCLPNGGGGMAHAAPSGIASREHPLQGNTVRAGFHRETACGGPRQFWKDVRADPAGGGIPGREQPVSDSGSRRSGPDGQEHSVIS